MQLLAIASNQNKIYELLLNYFVGKAEWPIMKRQCNFFSDHNLAVKFI